MGAHGRACGWGMACMRLHAAGLREGRRRACGAACMRPHEQVAACMRSHACVPTLGCAAQLTACASVRDRMHMRLQACDAMASMSCQVERCGASSPQAPRPGFQTRRSPARWGGRQAHKQTPPASPACAWGLCMHVSCCVTPGLAAAAAARAWRAGGPMLPGAGGVRSPDQIKPHAHAGAAGRRARARRCRRGLTSKPSKSARTSPSPAL